MGAIGVHHTETAEGAWDGPANEGRLRSGESQAYYRRCYAWQDPVGDVATKAAYKFPHHFVGQDGEPGAASVRGCQAGIAVVNGGRGGASIPDGDRRGVYDHLAAHLRDADQEPAPFTVAGIGQGPDSAGRLWTDPVACEPRLAVPDEGGGWRAEVLDEDRRRELRGRLAAGELDRLSFVAVTFRAQYPNRNFLRFRDGDLGRLAGSYVQVPFLRDHDTKHIDARAGRVVRSEVEDGAFVQTIELTVPRDIEAFLNGQMDRFSIGWFHEGITCSVCGADFLSLACSHWPGRKYRRRSEGGADEEALCELIFERPVGKEVSAVNAPAVDGTGVQGVLWAAAWKVPPDEVRSGKSAAAGEGVELLPLASFTAEGAEGAEGEEDGEEAGGGMVDEMTQGSAAPVGEVAAELLEAQRVAVLDARLAGSGLPAEMQDLVRYSLAPEWRVPELDAAIVRTRSAWARLEEKRTVQNMAPRAGEGRVGGMLDSLDQVGLALEGLLMGQRPARGVRPLSGIREFYTLMSGDYDMHGLFHPENVGLAAVDSSTMAGLVANVLNKVVVSQFAQYPRWWEPICTVVDFGSLQTAQWITLGGVGELPTVSEGAAYTEMAWDDQKETASWVKKGGYLGITLEAIDKDDTQRIRQAGPALARAAWITLGKAVSAIFTQTSGTGPLMSDSVRLFHAGTHGNLGTTALSYSAWAAVKLAMRKQTELNSGERLGGLVQPRFLLVPPDLEATALGVLASEGQPGTANNDENIYAEGNMHDARMAAAARKVIVVDFWTDTNNWAAVADPDLYPSIGLGYRFGRSPEIFSVATANSGLMFTNDTMPIKVRYFFAVGPTDWRGLYKMNVA